MLYYIYLIVLLILIASYPILKKINIKVVLYFSLLLFILAGLYLVFNADPYLRGSDQMRVWSAVKNINNGNYVDFEKGQYLNFHPLQLGLVTFERLIATFSENITFLYFLNLLFNIGSIILLWLISKVVYENKVVQNLTAIISVLFTPLLFNTLFVYGNVYGLTFLLGAVYTQLLSLNKKGKKRIIYGICTIILAGMAYLVKPNFEIGIVAMAIVYFLAIFRKRYYIILALGVLLVIPTVNISLGKMYSHEINENISLSGGIPKLTYVVMGLSEDSNGRIGWYTGYNDKTFSDNDYNTNKAEKIAKKDLRKRIDYLKKHKTYTRKIFIKKIISTWTDSTYQSIWNGPLPTWGGKINTDIMRIIYIKDGESKLYKFIRYGSVVIVWTIFLFSITCTLLYLTGKMNIDENYLLYAVIFFIGGFIFHTFWETKAQYVYQYTASLIPVASVGLYKVMDFIWNKIGKLKHK
ncbi:ArnT family glycosyltransferase [Ligilactobacillus salivarius]|uniref:ArnT family glycosyltransferase n=1 Tax=Ligilactobacillus salivarius TaxID=1624 RepID=UPI001CDAF63E|nr:glycosyltransferase family 39 protein [Ligilactobacillus salivarius]